MLRFILALLFVLLPARLMALDSVSVTPATAYVQGTGAGMISVRWSLQITVASDTTVTVTSTGGTLVAGSQPAVATGGTLRRTVRLSAGTHVVRITERLRVDRTSARHILESGTGSFNRVFTDTLAGTAAATVVLAARSSGSGGLTLQNLDLSFDDGATLRVVTAGEALTARAAISTSGRGVIKGKWEIAGPQGGFRTLGRFNLTAAGPRRAVVESPALPTDRAGSFRVRVILDGDGEGQGDPAISYTVGADAGLAAVTLTAPEEGASIGLQTRFAWGEVTGAVRYRIEFLSAADLTPLASLETASRSARIKSFTLERLSAGGALVWRVLALDAGGAEIGRSAQRGIAAP